MRVSPCRLLSQQVLRLISAVSKVLRPFEEQANANATYFAGGVAPKAGNVF